MKDDNLEIKMITEEINAALKIDKVKSDYNFIIGEFVQSPNTLGCIKRNGKWYMYRTDEKNFCIFNGPFNVKGIIYSCALKLGIAKQLKKYEFTEEEIDIYVDNHFRSFEEIDRYDKNKNI